jgi:2,3-bisphosphoglycerate-independent phosphoglycerate mutase
MTEQLNKPRPVVLCIMDGWGQRSERDHNAVALANTPNVDRLTASEPSGYMRASGADVGLPDGQMGNSEVGHMNLGAGRVVMQDLPRISKAVADGTMADIPALKALIDKAKAGTGRCHLLGLTSPGGVHAHQSHIAALARVLTDAGIDVLVHAFLDGRDTPPKSARGDIERLLAELPDGAKIATISGRFYAMDRDNRWERVEKAYKVIAEAEGNAAADPLSEIDRAYAAGETDEFVTPAAMPSYDGVKDGDVLLSANFRADRMREILASLLDPEFDAFVRARPLKFAAAAGMVSYSSALDPFLSVLFPALDLKNTLGETVAKAGLAQLRMAETEKYPHVTFFLNGGREEVFEGEDRIMVPSPKVRTYDLQPEMSAPELTEKLVDAIKSGKYDLIVCNFANPDMVGHTGSLEAAIKAVEIVDGAVGKIEAALRKTGGCMFLTADHGNCELMRDPENGGPHTAHTTNLVPTVLVNAPAGIESLATGRLADVAPTLLDLLGLAQPADMTGTSMLRTSAASAAE